MKTNKIIILLLAFVTSISFTSCVDDADYSVPQTLGVEENIKLNSLLDSINNNLLELKSISDVKALYISGNDPVKIASNIVVKGYVVSSDASGNFFREFYMQDKPNNPTSGIKVALNLNDIYNKYNFGREVYIRLKGIYVGETNSGDGVTAIGGKIKLTDTREIESITLNQSGNHIFRSQNTEIIVPKIVTLGGIDNVSNIGTYVKVENAFFSGDVEGKAYIDPAEDFDTKRKIETCQGLGFVDSFVETSSFADFANIALPDGGGSLNGIVTRDFGGDFTVLVLNSAADVDMNGTKCTPAPLVDFPTTLLDENFDTTSGNININGWTNYREAGTESWESYFDTNTRSRAARVGSFRSGDASTITWLITNDIDLDNTTEEYLSFETSTSFADGSELEVLISTDWDGTEAGVSSATWETLPARIASNSSNFREFFSSTFINLSDYTGSVYIAFKYTGNGDEDFDGTYELDNLVINAK
ncbi:DUF5689 domain-containing protein [Polaribacter porphyrae]|uniref:DUF5689 domain-containing protein n=1 Tax=Polaribacter porphyrae TaxID=1137780 RepID=A0A2S7WQ74_9FLAO|nr:DUF5689 domain-containing protein [Polaribacter porphyrae]PQJ79765.1 hypothetical protein BTO18_11525 [Polaribacter porphyrae]